MSGEGSLEGTVGITRSLPPGNLWASAFSAMEDMKMLEVYTNALYLRPKQGRILSRSLVLSINFWGTPSYCLSSAWKFSPRFTNGLDSGPWDICKEERQSVEQIAWERTLVSKPAECGRSKSRWRKKRMLQTKAWLENMRIAKHGECSLPSVNRQSFPSGRYTLGFWKNELEVRGFRSGFVGTFIVHACVCYFFINFG